MAKVFTLPNGVRGVCDERPGSGKVVVNVFIKQGSAYEPLEEVGLTALTQDASVGGTATRSRREISSRIENSGGNFFVHTEKGAAVYTLSALKEAFKDSFDVIADVIFNPAFDAQEVEKARKQKLQEIATRDQDPSAKARRLFFESAFANQPVGKDSSGDEALVKEFSLGQVKAKHKKLLAHPERIVVSFSGDITLEETKDLTAQYFGALTRSEEAVPGYAAEFSGVDYREENDNEQLNIVFGFPAPKKHDPGYYATVLLNEIFSGVTSSPLFYEIREKRGLVYSVGSNYVPFSNAGLFLVAAGTGKGNVGQLLDVTFGLLGDAVKEGYAQELVDQAIARLVRKRASRFEGTMGASATLAKHLFDLGKLESLEEYRAKLEKVSVEDIRRVCIEMMQSGTYALSAIGPQDTMLSEDEIKARMQSTLEGVDVPLPVEVRSQLEQEEGAVKTTADESAVRAMEPRMTILSNGMKVVSVERPGFMALGAWVGAGSDGETPEINGATHMNEHMMFRGTPSYGPGEIDKVIEAELAGYLNAYTSNDMTAYYFYDLDIKDAEKVVDICGEMVFEANIDNAEFDGKGGHKGERDVVIEEIKQYDDDVDSRLWYQLDKTAYPEQSHGRPILGTEDTIRAMTVEKLRAYRDDYYTPNNVVFSMAGPMKHEEFVAIIEKKFGAMPRKDVEELPVPQMQSGVGYLEMKSAEMCNLALMMEGVSSADLKESLVYDVLGKALGSGESSPLYLSIVDEQQLSDYAYSFHQDARNTGNFYVFGDVEAADAKAFIASAYQELHKIAEAVSQEVLDKVKKEFKMSFLGLEKNHKVCDFYGSNALSANEAIGPKAILEQLEAITVEDVKRAASQVLASEQVLGVVAPVGTDKTLIPQTAEELKALRDEGKPQKKRSVVPKKSL